MDGLDGWMLTVLLRVSVVVQKELVMYGGLGGAL